MSDKQILIPRRSFLRGLNLALGGLAVGYSLPAFVAKKIKADRIRFFFSGANLFTLTKLDTKYIDPEQASPDADINGRVYPFFKSYSFGLNLSF